LQKNGNADILFLECVLPPKVTTLVFVHLTEVDAVNPSSTQPIFHIRVNFDLEGKEIVDDIVTAGPPLLCSTQQLCLIGFTTTWSDDDGEEFYKFEEQQLPA
jgi:hypothetical protein